MNNLSINTLTLAVKTIVSGQCAIAI